ncbi:MAG TPA: pyridine nucleotide-disulfide oxidoreductase [Nitrospinae bacterium]|nr:pyridine nucleotide-disulfide oxidoreductase [Nitrospinota bacterium]
MGASPEERFDLVCIGGGVAGLVAAAGAALLGARAAVVERGKLGGDCLNYGCVPSKGLIHAARLAASARRLPEFGIDTGEVRVDFSRVMRRMKEVQAHIGEHDEAERFEGMGIEVIFGEGRFTGPDAFEAGGRRIRARRFLIATGSGPFVPDTPGLRDVLYLTNETVFDLSEQPRRMAVLGAGPIGLELAQAFQQLGTEVEVLELMPKLLPRLDPEMADLLREALLESGLRMHFEVKITRVEKRGNTTVIHAETPQGPREYACDALLAAVGRKPNIEGLGLDAAGVKHSPRGVETDATLRTSNPKIYAAGDVRGGFQFTHVAEYEAGIALRNMLFSEPFGIPVPFLKKKASYDAVPWAIYTTPEAAHVGMTEAEAREALGEVQVLRFPMDRVDRAVLEGETAGFCKLVCDARGRLVGADLVGISAGEILHEFALAVRKKLHVKEVVETIHVYPTLAQVNKRAAGMFYARKLFTPAFRKKMQRLFGLRGSVDVRDPGGFDADSKQ